MKKYILIGALTVLLSGCSSKPEVYENTEALAKLPVATQVALVLRGPLEIFAMATVTWVIVGSPFVKIVSRRRSFRRGSAE